jgi:hypothetical protein
LRDIAAALGITERSVYAIVTDLADAGYVAKHKDGHRNRYQIHAHLPLPEPASQLPSASCSTSSPASATPHKTADTRPPAYAPMPVTTLGSRSAIRDDHPGRTLA